MPRAERTQLIRSIQPQGGGLDGLAAGVHVCRLPPKSRAPATATAAATSPLRWSRLLRDL